MPGKKPSPPPYLIFRSFLTGFAMMCLLGGCSRDTTLEPVDRELASRFVLDWNNLLLDLERNTPGYRPPISARMFAYVELAGYESALPALPDHISMNAYLDGYNRPSSDMNRTDFCLPAGVNAGYAQIIRNFFPTAPRPLLERIRQMEAMHLEEVERKLGCDQSYRSVAYGRSIADAVWKWSVADTIGHDGFLYNFDRNYIMPNCPGCWQPSGSHPMPPLAPHWGEARPFIVHPGDVSVKPPLQFCEAPGSAFYTEAMEVFTISQPLSRENKWIAEYWSDDVPGLTLTPAGRWISITNQAVEKAHPQFPEIMDTYLRVGLALCDAGIICWNTKYRYNVERPGTYIRQNIQPGWESLHDDPSFPSYPSGHSIFGAAVAEILTHTFGEHFSLTDRTHEDRPEFASTPRTFHSFDEMARENALSRVALGVHYRMDCEEGLRLGKMIGQKIENLGLQKPEASKR